MAMHHDQVHIDVHIARRLVHESFPEFSSEPVRAVESAGTVNAIFRVGATASARFPLQAADPAFVEAWLREEETAALEFARCCPFPAPRPIGIGRPGSGYPMPWAMQTWVEGDVASPSGLASSEAFASDIAVLLESLRRADTHGRTFSGGGRGGRISAHDGWIATCLAESAGLLDVTVLGSLWHELRQLPPAGPDVMSHRDLTPPNFLVRGEHVVGVLDAGGFGPADPAVDLVAAWHMLDRRGRDLVRERLGCATDEWLRGAAWSFVQAMGLVWYYETTNPAMSELGRSTLGRLVDDPEVPR